MKKEGLENLKRTRHTEGKINPSLLLGKIVTITGSGKDNNDRKIIQTEK